MKPDYENTNFNDIYDILDHIEWHTGLFLLKRDLDLLYTYISGISFMEMNNKNLKLKNSNAFNNFSVFVHQKMKLKTENTMGWFGAIRFEYGSGEKGFNKFFEYLNEYRKT